MHALPEQLPRHLGMDNIETAKKEAERLYDIFGKDHFYLELQDHGIADQATVNQGLLRMSEELKIPLVATNDVHYITAEDAEPHDILLCIQTQKRYRMKIACAMREDSIILRAKTR